MQFAASARQRAPVIVEMPTLHWQNHGHSNCYFQPAELRLSPARNVSPHQKGLAEKLTQNNGTENERSHCQPTTHLDHQSSR